MVVDVAGIGYRVFVPRQPTGTDVLLHTHHVVREDDESLFGFDSREELALFELLIGVSGVGPRAALALLSVARAPDVATAIAAGDSAFLARAPGVGRKTAERLIVDLRSKVAGISTGGVPPSAALEDEAQAALVALGYTPAEAAVALRQVPSPEQASTEERLSAALKLAARR